MRMIALVGGVLVACGNPPSKLDSLPETADDGTDDPWAVSTPSKPGAPAAKPDGMDLKGMLAKIGETLEAGPVRVARALP